MTLTEHRLRIGERAVTLLEGPVGWGECSPLPGYPCDPVLAHRAAEEAACAGWPPPRRRAIPVNALVEHPPVDAAALAGFPSVKVKVGRSDRRADVDLVAAVREAVGTEVAVRVDANGAWDVDTAATMLDELARFDLELAEQPVGSLADLARVRRLVAIPVAADECVRSVDDARMLAELDAADAVVLKVQPSGGVRAALELAEAADVPAIVTSMRETSIGIAAGLALAAALPELPYACGLAARMEGGDVVVDPLVPADGSLALRTVRPDQSLLARYEVSS